MKSKIALSLFVLLLAFSACKKDTQSQISSETDKVALSSHIPRVFTVENNNSYVDLDALPGQSYTSTGQSYTTYHCIWNNVDIYVVGPYWDSATYPGLSTGYPLYANDVHAAHQDGNQNTPYDPFVTYASQTGVTGTVFTVTVPTLCGGWQNLDKLAQDIALFNNTLSFFNYSGPPPNLEAFVSGDYGSADCPQTTFRLKLIRSTTSSTGYAVATANYPVTPIVPYANSLRGNYHSDTYSIWYKIFGSNGHIFKAQCTINGAVYYLSASGTYTTNSSGETQLVGTFVDQTGANISFNFTEYPN